MNIEHSTALVTGADRGIGKLSDDQDALNPQVEREFLAKTGAGTKGS